MKTNDEEILFAEGFEEALIGIGRQFNNELAVYDTKKCIKILMKRDKMKRTDAEEFFEYNVLGAYTGEHTPIFI